MLTILYICNRGLSRQAVASQGGKREGKRVWVMESLVWSRAKPGSGSGVRSNPEAEAFWAIFTHLKVHMSIFCVFCFMWHNTGGSCLLCLIRSYCPAFEIPLY